jgi:hypothetical protein
MCHAVMDVVALYITNARKRINITIMNSIISGDTMLILYTILTLLQVPK